MGSGILTQSKNYTDEQTETLQHQYTTLTNDISNGEGIFQTGINNYVN
jgi:hypothetical protein